MSSVKVDRGKGLRTALLVAPLLLVALSLWPALATGYLGDDSAFSYVNGAIGYTASSWWQVASHANKLWLESNGRLFPFAVYEKYLIFHIFTGVWTYKMVLLSLTLASWKRPARIAPVTALQN